MADNYIVRIYRCEKHNPARLVGLVEEVGIEGKRGFTSLEELWEILNSPVICRKREAASARGKPKQKD